VTGKNKRVQQLQFDAPAKRGNMQRELSQGWSGGAGIATPAKAWVSHKSEWL
jgi:hypothetical protein